MARTDVPCDMTNKLMRGKTKRAQPARQAAPRVVTDHYERRTPIPASHREGRRFVWSKQGRNHPELLPQMWLHASTTYFPSQELAALSPASLFPRPGAGS